MNMNNSKTVKCYIMTDVETMLTLNCVHIESEKGGVDDEEMGGCHFSYYFTVQFNHILCV